MTLAENLVAHEGDASKVILSLGELGELAIQSEAIDHRGSMPYSTEIESLTIGHPHKLIDIAVEGTAHKSLGSSSEVHHIEAVPVALVAIALHALPGNHGAVG